MTNTVFANTLQTLRKKNGVTQEKLAFHLGVSPQAVSKWENGSFPDGDLLPKIADFFQVSIDYLYGRDQEKVTVEQAVLDSIKAATVDSKNDYKVQLEQIMRNAWAAQLGFWMENKTYYDRAEPEGDNILASLVTSQEGLSFFRLNKDLEYYLLMKQPEEGFASYFRVTDALVSLFSFLGKRENLEVLFYLLSLTNGECVSSSTISKKLNITQKAAETALDYLSRATENESMLRIISVLDEHDKTESVYSVNMQTTTAILLLLAGADAFIHSPCGYALSICNRTSSWFERDKLNFLKPKGVGTTNIKEV